MMENNQYKVALVTESLYKMAGAAKVLECFAEIFPQADIFALFSTKGDRRGKMLSKTLLSHKIYTSKLNRYPLIEKWYRYTIHKWPNHIEMFNLSEYDLVISSSSSVAHGVLTGIDTKHIAYIHSPMRYIWDMQKSYFGKKNGKSNYFFPVRVISSLVSNYLRIWDISASMRADLLIANSKFVNERMKKYWKREANAIIYPPVNKYRGRIEKERENYFVAGAPYEANKGGEFLLETASKIGYPLKIIGCGSLMRKLQKKYSSCKNIEFLGWVDEDKKYKILSKARGYMIVGIEDFGIFPVEAMSCGTPVLAYGVGGALESIKEGVNGMFFYENSIESFEEAYEKFLQKKWDYEEISKSIECMNSKEDFKEKFKKFLVDNGVHI